MPDDWPPAGRSHMGPDAGGGGMMAFIYILVASGFMEAGYGFWAACAWPSTVGREIARRIRKADSDPEATP